MSFSILLWGLLFWALAFLSHFTLWRLQRPKDDLRALLLFFTLGPSVGGGAALCMGQPLDTTALSLLLAMALGAAYSCWYPAAQAASPTMLICVTVGAGGKAGIESARLKEILCSNDLLTRETFENLFAEHFAVVESGDRVRLAPRGRRTLRLIQAFRWLAGFKEPKG